MKKFIAGLQQYMMEEGNENSPMQELEMCSDSVELQSPKRKRQSTLDEFSEKKFDFIFLKTGLFMPLHFAIIIVLLHISYIISLDIHR